MVTYRQCVYEETQCDLCGMTLSLCNRLGMKFHCSKYRDPFSVNQEMMSSDSLYRICQPFPLFSDCHDLCDSCYKKVLKSQAEHDGVFEYTDAIKPY